MQNPFVFREKSLEVVENARPVHIASIWIVSLVIVDVHLNIGKNWVQNADHKSNDGNWSFLHQHMLHFLIGFCISFLLSFNVRAVVSFLTKIFDKFQFKIQIRLSQTKVLVPIRLKFKRYPVFKMWCSR